jgi:hypothetical protein
MWHILLKIGFGLLAVVWPVFIAWGVIYANKVEERHWIAEQRALEAARKAARLRMLDAWAAERDARLAELDSSAEDDMSEEEPASGQKLLIPKEPPSKDGGVDS